MSECNDFYIFQKCWDVRKEFGWYNVSLWEVKLTHNRRATHIHTHTDLSQAGSEREMGLSLDFLRKEKHFFLTSLYRTGCISRLTISDNGHLLPSEWS